MVFALKTRKMRQRGDVVYLCMVKDLSSEEQLESIPVVQDYPDVFPKELSGIPLDRCGVLHPSSDGYCSYI